MAVILFAAAALLFWLAWALMPGVGVTDAEQIFQLVSAQRSLVLWSVVLQLVSAALYVPGTLAIISDEGRRRVRGVRWGTALMLMGAMGSAADAVLHLLAYAMTAPGLERAPLARVMTFMQGPGLVLLAPMILSFFVGGVLLSVAFARIGVVSRWNPRLHGIALLLAVFGGLLAGSGLLPPRAVGLATLGSVSIAQAWIGLALWGRGTADAASGREAPFCYS
jgi:hypothetical protein